MDIVYSMPEQQHRMFINIVHACPNACFFCVDFKGETFCGFDLQNRPCTDYRGDHHCGRDLSALKALHQIGRSACWLEQNRIARPGRRLTYELTDSKSHLTHCAPW